MILWIDPGVRKLWYALINKDLSIVDSGILLSEIKSPTRMNQFERMRDIEEYFTKLCKKYTIETMSMEKLFFTRFNQNNAEFVFGIRAILITLCLKNNIKIKEYTPIQLKKFVTGNGKAEKILVQKCIMKLYGLKEFPEFNDAADALALAYIGLKIK
ncbi:MAG: Crossover junction endodeoxyribonuclease ruvC [uncultured bacterium (gcode 4)]|uniref:Crossover junction endodeoxyribonuclease ruvC n=1 Tax=uncultured bacterium (gcode 4) TaxID=1234023 RepID=K1X498_9BACT|nr:MAG: Crossover junction endodeoxyribonuclease ruvC [uncultured bacterium (gcode 4)]